MSLPSWERGLKSDTDAARRKVDNVAPFVGAWIEIVIWKPCQLQIIVAPFVGAWIEISRNMRKAKRSTSRSLRGSVD